MNFLAVVPARGGSKGVPGKNLRQIGGLPLVVHALKSGCSFNTLVSTDNEEIEKICKAHGGWVPFLRPAELAGDEAKTADTLKHAIEWYETDKGMKVDAVITLQPTTPFRTAEDVCRAASHFESLQNCESLISVCRMEQYHPLTLYQADGNYLEPFVKGLDPNTRRQDFPDVYWRNGAIYITARDYLFKTGRTTSDSPAYYEMPAERSMNIDSLQDLEITQFLWERHDA